MSYYNDNTDRKTVVVVVALTLLMVALVIAGGALISYSLFMEGVQECLARGMQVVEGNCVR